MANTAVFASEIKFIKMEKYYDLKKIYISFFKFYPYSPEFTDFLTNV